MKIGLYLISFLGLFIACSTEDYKESTSSNVLIDASSASYADLKAVIDAKLIKNPNEVSLLVNRANLALEYYDYPLAFSDAAKAFRLDSNYLDSRLVYALSMINQGQRSVADIRVSQRHFQFVVSEDVNNTKAMVGLANTYALQQDFELAREWIAKALIVDPKFFDAHVLKGSMYKVLSVALNGDKESEKLSKVYLDSAIQAYSRVSQYYPDRPEIYIELGILFQQSNNEICVDYYYSAVQLAPENLDYKYALAYAYGLFEQERKAMAVYEEMQEQDSLFCEAFCQMGQIYQKKFSEIDSALNMYRTTIEIDENHIDAYVNMGVIYEEQKDYNSAIRSYAKALAIQPEQRGPYMPLSDFSEIQGLAREYAEGLKNKL